MRMTTASATATTAAATLLPIITVLSLSIDAKHVVTMAHIHGAPKKKLLRNVADFFSTTTERFRVKFYALIRAYMDMFETVFSFIVIFTKLTK